MNKKSLLIFACFFTFLSSCSNQLHEFENCNIVVVFRNAPRDCYVKNSSGRIHGFSLGDNSEYISYMDTSKIEQFFAPNTTLDTLCIATGGREFVELQHCALGTERFFYLLQAGDTVTFCYDSLGMPTAHSKLSVSNTLAYNAYPKRLMRSTCSSYSTITFAKGTSHHFEKWYLDSCQSPNPPVVKLFMQNYIDVDSVERVARELILEDARFFDSLLATGTISDVQKAHIHRLYHQDSLRIWNSNPKVKGRRPFHYTISQLCEAPIGCPSTSIILLHYLSHVEGTRSNVRRIKTPYSNEVNYGDIFANIESNNNIPAAIKTELLYICLEKIIKTSSVGDVSIYSSRFLNITSDTVRYQYLMQGCKLNPASSSDLVLLSVTGDSTTFAQVMLEYGDKVVYVDFWASGCAPCCAGMPAAKKLRAEYAGKDVVFLYLALNDKEAPWRRAIAHLEMADANSLNYLIANSKTSKMLEELDVRLIPRLMLYNRQGQLVHANAPSPESAEIRGLLDKYLAE